MKPELGCAEPCLPGNLEEKLQACVKYNLWLELVNKGRRDLSTLNSYDVEVKTVQAYLLHQYSLIGRARAERRAAKEHVKSTVEVASEVGARYVLTVPSYGYGFAEQAHERCRRAFEDLAAYAGDHGVILLVEALSPRKSSFLPSLGMVHAFIASLNVENIALAADTRHAFDAGEDILAYRDSVAELHLKDSEALPPGRGEINFKRILRHPWPQLCLEYQSEGGELEGVLDFLGFL
jgi:sugar phosphate isomerase/epimerase